MTTCMAGAAHVTRPGHTSMHPCDVIGVPDVHCACAPLKSSGHGRLVFTSVTVQVMSPVALEMSCVQIRCLSSVSCVGYSVYKDRAWSESCQRTYLVFHSSMTSRICALRALTKVSFSIANTSWTAYRTNLGPSPFDSAPRTLQTMKFCKNRELPL